MKDYTLKLQAQPTPAGFEMLAITAGEAKGHGITFSAAVLQESLSLWEGLPVGIDHPGPFDGPSVRNLAGVITAPTWSQEHEGIRLTLKPAGPAASVLTELRDAITAAPELANIVGFSAVLRLQYKNTGEVTKIVSVRGVDAVIDPARGGRFLSASAGTPTNVQKGAHTMHEDITQAAENAAQPEQTQDTFLRALCAHTLTASLNASMLPEASKAAISKQFAGRVFSPDDLETAITEKRAEIAAITGAGLVQGPGRAAFSQMFDSGDQMQAAVDDLLEAPRDEDKKGLKVARLSGIREAYLLATGDRDFTGSFFPEFALATAANFPVIVKNSLNKRLAEAWNRYGAAGYDWWSSIVKVEHFETLQQIDWTILGTIGSLPSIAEGAEYTELTIGDNGGTSDWTKYGGYVGLSLEAILRDNVRAFRRLPDEVAMGGMRNISEQVAAIFTTASGAGPTLSDGGALFNATAVTTAGGHANLLTTALGTDMTAWRAVETAMYVQPMHIANETGQYGAGKAQAVRPAFLLVPIELKGAADDLFLKTWTAAGENLAYRQAKPLVVPEWTDGTDWAAVADPNILPGIMLGEIFGLKPQIYLAGSESDPAFFTNDESRIKVRQFLTVGIANWRALHKSNVAGG